MTSINVNDKMKIQQLLNSNIIRAGGDFHSDSLDEDVFIYEINKNFKLTPKENKIDVHQLLENIIKLSTVRVRGYFNSRELKQSKFFKELFKNFEIEKK